MYYIIGDDKDKDKEKDEERKDTHNDSLDQLLKDSQKNWLEEEQPREIDYKAEIIELRASVHINKPVPSFPHVELSKTDA